MPARCSSPPRSSISSCSPPSPLTRGQSPPPPLHRRRRLPPSRPRGSRWRALKPCLRPPPPALPSTGGRSSPRTTNATSPTSAPSAARRKPAQEALGHNSKAVHRAYAGNAQVTLPSLELYERKAAMDNVIPLCLQQGVAMHGTRSRRAGRTPGFGATVPAAVRHDQRRAWVAARKGRAPLRRPCQNEAS